METQAADAEILSKHKVQEELSEPGPFFRFLIVALTRNFACPFSP